MDNIRTILKENITTLKSYMNETSDLTVKEAKAGGHDIAIVFCEGMIDTNAVANMIYRPLNNLAADLPLEVFLKMVKSELLLAGEQKEAGTYKELGRLLMSGFLGIMIDGVETVIAIGVQGFKTRAVDEPSTHSNVRSSREGFVEVVRTNAAMVRRRMKSEELVLKMITLGDRSNTDACVCYIKDKADPLLVRRIFQKLSHIGLNTIIDGGCIQPFLSDNGNALISEIGTTERPDNFVAKLYDGRIGIIVDGTPFAVYLPRLFTESFSVADDYTARPIYASIIRIIRYIAYLISILLPGVYVAIGTFCPEVFPNELLMNLISAFEKTPFPLFAECFVIHLFYEIIREGGLRLPKNVGHAVSIVGGLVVGDIVISAGLIGAPLVLIVAISAITSFVVPDLHDSTMVMRFAFIIAGGLLGLFGIALVGMFFLLELCSLKSFGVPYMAPLSPFTFAAMRDTFIRVSWKKLAAKDMKIQDLNGVDIKHDK